jgi:hypothetical protein
MLDNSGAVAEEIVGTSEDEDIVSSEYGIEMSMLEEDAAGGSSAGAELLESEEHAKKAALAAVTITRDAANFLSIL